jgi:hypothetical protein
VASAWEAGDERRTATEGYASGDGVGQRLTSVRVLVVALLVQLVVAAGFILFVLGVLR